jgi:phosphoenolpyruvate synthase/pyruvate phosphate dikinase
VGTGELHVDVDEALDAMDDGRAVVFAVETPSPGDVVAMVRAAGIITVLGSAGSHAAIVARHAGVPAVLAVVGLEIDGNAIAISGIRIAVGAELQVDGDAGVVRWDAT